MNERLTRRRVLGWLGGLGLAVFLPGCADDESDGSAAGTTARQPATTATTASPDCLLTPEVTEGPYYLDLDLVRSDITEGRPGMPFDLVVKVVDADGCKPIKDAAVDIWHCDAGGAYSGVEGETGSTFLRGIQVTDASGDATFRTIFPGWYTGRAVHIHLKVLLGGSETFTGQLFFDDDVLDAVYKTEPYDARGAPDTTNERDGIYGQSGGTTIVDVTRGADSYSGSVSLGVERV